MHTVYLRVGSLGSCGSGSIGLAGFLRGITTFDSPSSSFATLGTVDSSPSLVCGFSFVLSAMANGKLSPIATAEATSGDVSSICVSITVIASRRSGVISCVNGRAFGSPCLGSLSIGVGYSTSSSSVATASCSASCTFFCFSPSGPLVLPARVPYRLE
jgi:hypothetical protein